MNSEEYLFIFSTSVILKIKFLTLTYTQCFVWPQKVEERGGGIGIEENGPNMQCQGQEKISASGPDLVSCPTRPSTSRGERNIAE